MRRKQRGITLLGWIVLLIPVALVVYAGIRLAPVYLNYYRVARSISQVAEEAKGDDTTNAGTLRSSLGKRLDIESVEFPDLKDFAIKERHRITFRVEAFNWLNHPNWNGADTNPNNVVLDSSGKVDPQKSTFGKVSSKGGNRELQFALRYQF